MAAGGTDRQVGVPGTVRAAAVLAGLEALALIAAAVVLLVKTATGRPEELAGALLQALLAVLAAAVLLGAARGLLRLRPGARTPLLVLQLLALPVAYSLWIQAGVTLYGAPIMVAALVEIALLFAPPTRDALDRAAG